MDRGDTAVPGALTLHHVSDVVQVQVLQEEVCARVLPSPLLVEGAGDGPQQLLVQELDHGAAAAVGKLGHHGEGEASSCPAVFSKV